MKRIFSLVIAGIIGGLITVGGLQMMNKQQTSYTDTLSPATFTSHNNNNLNITPRPAAFDFTVAAEKATKAVVHISAAESEQMAQERRQNSRNPYQDLFGDNPFFGNQLKKGMGSGVIISEDGYIVTNNHVVEFADQVEVTLFDNRSYRADVVGTYPQADLAVLKIDENRLPTLDYADSDVAKIGQWVLAVGNPLELTSTVTAGIISAKGRDLDIIKDNRESNERAIEAFIQTDAAVNPGNSGGALVDDQGRLLGINTAIATRTGYYSGYSFAIPVNLMKRIVEDIIEFGSYQKGSLGVYVAELTNEVANELGLNQTKGVVVTELIRGCAAEYSGIITNDIITAINGQKINSFPVLQEKISRVKINDTLEVTVNRKGAQKEDLFKVGFSFCFDASVLHHRAGVFFPRLRSE